MEVFLGAIVCLVVTLAMIISPTSPDPRWVPWWDLRWRSRCSGASPFWCKHDCSPKLKTQKYPRYLILNFEYPRCLIVTLSAPCLPRRSSLCWRCPRSGCCRPFKFYLIFVFFIVLIIVVDRELLAIGNGGRRELVTLHLLLLNRRSIKQQQ